MEALLGQVESCFRHDFRFEFMSLTVLGVKIFREDLEKYKIKDFIQPGKNIEGEVL